MNQSNDPKLTHERADYMLISLDSKIYGRNSFRVELLIERPPRPFSKDQRNRIHSKLGIPAHWTWKFTWDRQNDMKMINGLAINGDVKNFSESVNNVILEIIHCIVVGRIVYDDSFNRINPYVQKLIIAKMMRVINGKKTTLQVVSIFDNSENSKMSRLVWVNDIPLSEGEILRLEEFIEQCQGNQKDEIIKKLRLFATVPNYLDEISSEIKSIKNSIFGDASKDSR